MMKQTPETPIAFTIQQALEHGITRGQIRSRRFARPWRGVRIAAEQAGNRFVQAYAAQLARPDAVVSHSSAAELLGLPVHTRSALHLTTDAAKAPPAKTRAQQPGIVAHRSTLTPIEVMNLAAPVVHPSNFDGRRTACEQIQSPQRLWTKQSVRVTTPLRTWIDLAAEGCSVNKLVVVGDALVSARYAFCTRDELIDSVTDRRRIRGIRNLRRAARLIRTGTDSPKETELRLFLLDAGFPEPEVTVPVIDPRTGATVAIPDLQYRRLRIAIEYDGDHHRADRFQWQHDLHRNDGLLDLEWRVLLATELTLSDRVQGAKFLDRLARMMRDHNVAR